MPIADTDVVGSPGWWMTMLARKMLDPIRLKRLVVLEAYRTGCPPLVNVSEAQRRVFYSFQRICRSNMASPIIRAVAERMAIRSIRTAAADDDNGDQVAWRYFTSNGLDIDQTDVTADMLTFSEGYVRVGVGPDGKPVAMHRDPFYCVVARDPLNKRRTRAGMELVWDEWTGVEYAYLWLPGQQWVASRQRNSKPSTLTVPGIGADDWHRFRRWIPKLNFDARSFDMRPNIDDVPESMRDGGPYSETYEIDRVPMVHFPNRFGVGEFEEHLDLIDRINHDTMIRVVAAAIQAYKQRALEQPAEGGDRFPETNPETGEQIDWDEVFMPGPDALWKLPPGVKIWESNEIQLQPLVGTETEDIKRLSALTSTPFSMFSPDGANQTAEGSTSQREGLVFKTEDRITIAARGWADVISTMFAFAPDADRFTADGADRADLGSIVIDWKNVERFSLVERAQADAANKSLSADMAASKIWGLSADEVAINKSQRASDVLLTPRPANAAAGQP